MNFQRTFLTFAFVLFCGMVNADSLSTGGFKVLQRISLPGDGGWDYVKVDSQARRVYITHDTVVDVLDADTLKLVGKIEGVDHGHGVALAPELNRGFVTGGDPGNVLIFDLKTLKTIMKVPAGKKADAVVYEPVTGQVFAFNGKDRTATVIDAATGKVVKTLDLGGKPEFAAVDEQGHVFDNLEDKSQLIRIDAKSLKITDRWPTAPGVSPSGLAIDTKSNRLFMGCDKQTVIMDAATGKVVQALPIGEGVDATYYDPDSARVFNSCGSGTLSVIHQDGPDQYSLVENAATEKGARTMGYDPVTGHVFMPVAKFGPAPTPTKEKPRTRGKMIPGSFAVLVVGQ